MEDDQSDPIVRIINRDGRRVSTALGDLGVDQFAAVGAEPRKSASFVLAHQAAVAGDIGGENGREPAFDPLSAQNLLPVGGLNLQSAPPTAEEQPGAGPP